MASEELIYPEYPVFKGLQRPLEYFGFRGRYVYWAAAAVAGAILGFLFLYILAGFMVGFLFAAVSFGGGLLMIFLKQHKGLHSKREDKGVFIYAFTRRFMY